LKFSYALQCYAVATVLCLWGCGGTTITGKGSDVNGSTTTAGPAGDTANGSGTATTSAGAASGGSSSGTASGGTSGGNGSSGTTTGAPPSCAAGAAACTPANICDNGCLAAGGDCLDLLTPNNAQTGVSCDAGAVCEGTICWVGSGPQVPDNGGGVLARPNLVLMTYDSDPNQAGLEQWGVWFMDGGILANTLGQYGVGNGTIQFVHLSGSMPASDTTSIDNYVQTQFTTDAAMPANTSNSIYLLSFPASWSGSSSFCQSQGGYHTFLGDQARNYPIYAVIADCGNSLQGSLEVSASHEIAEAATDPYPFEPAWAFSYSSTSPWVLSGGGEIGDMCESNSTHYSTSDGVDYSQYLWSNDAARLGQVPCQPWPADQVYVQTLGPATIQSVAPGTTANIPLFGWASGPIDQWGLFASDPISGYNFRTFPTLASETVAPGQQVMAQLNIPPATQGQPAIGGLIGGAWIFSATDDSHVYGSAMIEVQISCQTSADCSDPAQSCSSGVCDYNYCGSGAKALSTCTATQGSDGICLPFDTGSGPVEICSQVGSLTVGTQGCSPNRVVGGSASSYCDDTSICEGQSSPVCLTLCNPSGAGCTGSQYCWPLGQSYGFCVDYCSSTACPSGMSCYNNGQAVACYPD
jgi:hypothetical protein